MRASVLFCIAVAALGCGGGEEPARDGVIRGLEGPPAATGDRPKDSAIEAALAASPELSAHRLRLTKLDVRGEFAFAEAEAEGGQLDPIFVLLRKDGDKWKVLTFGTALLGAGAEFGVPKETAEEWGI
jgi:hypothetical protein